MKKFAFIMPLMTISFLVSCSNGGGDKPEPKPEVSTLPIKCSYYQHKREENVLLSEEEYEYNDKKLLTKSVNKFKAADITESHEYEYDDKNNITKDTFTYKEGETIRSDNTNYNYIYDGKGRILKRTISKNNENETVDEYTYESDLVDWDTHKHSDNGGETYTNIVTRTFKNGLYEKAIDYNPIGENSKYYYYTWNEYKCNSKIETYIGEEKVPTNHYSDETYEYHKNMPDKIKQYFCVYYEQGEIESSNKTLTEYDEYDRKIKISNYREQTLNTYMVYEYKAII